MIFNKQKDEQEFIGKIVKLSPEEFIALARLLNVKMSIVDKDSGEYSIRDAEEIALECAGVFRRLPHKARKAILKAMIKSKGVTDGSSTENSTN